MTALVDVDQLEVHFTARAGLLRSMFGRETPVVRAVDGVSFTLGKGEILCLAGESGSGKTTTGKAILRLVEPTAGKVYYAGEDVRAYNRSKLRSFRQEAQIIFQDPYESLNPRQTVLTLWPSRWK